MTASLGPMAGASINTSRVPIKATAQDFLNPLHSKGISLIQRHECPVSRRGCRAPLHQPIDVARARLRRRSRDTPASLFGSRRTMRTGIKMQVSGCAQEDVEAVTPFLGAPVRVCGRGGGLRAGSSGRWRPRSAEHRPAWSRPRSLAERCSALRRKRASTSAGAKR